MIMEMDLFDADQAQTALGKNERKDYTVGELDEMEALDGILRGETIDDCSDEIGYDPDPNAQANLNWEQR